MELGSETCYTYTNTYVVLRVPGGWIFSEMTNRIPVFVPLPVDYYKLRSQMLKEEGEANLKQDSEDANLH